MSKILDIFEGLKIEKNDLVFAIDMAPLHDNMLMWCDKTIAHRAHLVHA